METIDINKLSYEEKIDLASNNETSAELLAILAKDVDIDVRVAVAENPRTPYNTLIMLTKVKALEIREKAKEILKERTLKANTNKER